MRQQDQKGELTELASGPTTVEVAVGATTIHVSDTVLVTKDHAGLERSVAIAAVRAGGLTFHLVPTQLCQDRHDVGRKCNIDGPIRAWVEPTSHRKVHGNVTLLSVRKQEGPGRLTHRPLAVRKDGIQGVGFLTRGMEVRSEVVRRILAGDRRTTKSPTAIDLY